MSDNDEPSGRNKSRRHRTDGVQVEKRGSGYWAGVLDIIQGYTKLLRCYHVLLVGGSGRNCRGGRFGPVAGSSMPVSNPRLPLLRSNVRRLRAGHGTSTVTTVPQKVRIKSEDTKDRCCEVVKRNAIGGRRIVLSTPLSFHSDG